MNPSLQFQFYYFLSIFACMILINLYFTNIFDLLNWFVDLNLESFKCFELRFIYYFGFVYLMLTAGRRMGSISFFSSLISYLLKSYFILFAHHPWAIVGQLFWNQNVPQCLMRYDEDSLILLIFFCLVHFFALDFKFISLFFPFPLCFFFRVFLELFGFFVILHACYTNNYATN